MATQSTRLRLVGRLTSNPWLLMPTHCFAAGVTIYAGLGAYSANYSTVYGSIMLQIFLCMLALTLVLAGFMIFLPRLVVTVEADGLRVKPPFGRVLWIGWDEVYGFRGAPRRSLLVFDVFPEFWRRSGVKWWSGRGSYANAVIIMPARMAPADAFVAVSKLAPERVVRGAPPRPARPVWLRALFAGFAMAVCGLMLVALPSVALASRRSPPTRPAAVPVSPCSLLSAQTLKTVVPNAGPVESTGKQELTDSVKWTCVVGSTGEKPYGQLNISVTRLGSALGDAAVRRAEEQYENYRNSYLDDLAAGTLTTEVTGLGDQAVGVVRDTYVHISVRRGADLVDVRYTASPSTVDRMLAASTLIAREVLGGLR